jgi:hypothetical protein
MQVNGLFFWGLTDTQPFFDLNTRSRSLAKFNIGAASMRLGYYLVQWGDAVPAAASGRTCVFPEGPEGPLGAKLLCWRFRLPASFSSRFDWQPSIISGPFVL